MLRLLLIASILLLSTCSFEDELNIKSGVFQDPSNKEIEIVRSGSSQVEITYSDGTADSTILNISWIDADTYFLISPEPMEAPGVAIDSIKIEVLNRWGNGYAYRATSPQVDGFEVIDTLIRIADRGR